MLNILNISSRPFAKRFPEPILSIIERVTIGPTAAYLLFPEAQC